MKHYSQKKKAIGMAIVCGMILGTQLSIGREIAWANEEVLDEFYLDGVVVTATRTDQTVKEVPTTVQVITRQDIEKRQSRTLRDVLQNALGVTLWKDFQGRSQVRIRGSESRHVLIMVDGKRMSGELSYNSANAHEIDRINMDNVERVEIIRGSAGSLYGSDAIGGVVNIITRQPMKKQGSINYDYSFYEHGDSAGPTTSIFYQDINETGNMSWKISGSYNDSKPFYVDNEGTSNNYFGKEQNIDFGMTYTAENGNRLSFDFGQLNEDTQRSEAGQSYHPMMPKSDKINKNENKRTNLSLSYEGEDAKQNWSVRAYQSKYEKEYFIYKQTRRNNIVTIPYTLNSFDWVNRTINVLEGKDSWQLGDKHLATAGFEWRQDKSEGTRIKTDLNSKKTSDEASIDYVSLYFQDEIRPNDQWLFIPSIRFDHSNLFDSAWTGNLASTYHIADDTRLKFVVGQGYKTPTINELYHAWEMFAGSAMGGPGQYFQGNPNIKPEKSWNYELALEKDWNDKTTGHFGLFRNDVKELITSTWTCKYVDSAGNLVSSMIPTKDKLMTYKNIPEARMQGIEASIQHQLSDEVDLNFGYVYLDAKDQGSSQRLEDRPRHQLNLGLFYHPKDTNWQFNLDVVSNIDYWASKDGNITTGDKEMENSTFTVVNFLAQKDLDARASLYLGIDNLGNYHDYNKDVYGRMYRVGINCKF